MINKNENMKIYIPINKDCIELLEPLSIKYNEYAHQIIFERQPNWINNDIVILPIGTQLRFIQMFAGRSNECTVDIRNQEKLGKMVRCHIPIKKLNGIKFKKLDGFNIPKRTEPKFIVNWNWQCGLSVGSTALYDDTTNYKKLDAETVEFCWTIIRPFCTHLWQHPQNTTPRIKIINTAKIEVQNESHLGQTIQNILLNIIDKKYIAITGKDTIIGEAKSKRKIQKIVRDYISKLILKS